MFKEITKHLSEEKNFLKRDFIRRLNQAKNRRENWTTDTALVICEYLKAVHNILLPEDFAEQIVSAHNEFHLIQKHIPFPFQTVDAIVSSCNLWRPYIADSKEIFDKLVCLEILSMARIHASVIAGRNFTQQHSLPLKENPPFLFTTIVTEHGTLKVYS